MQGALEQRFKPTIIHTRFDADTLNLDPTAMLAVCFCCECCCDSRLILRDGPQIYWDANNHRLPGLSVIVGEGCRLCGACQKVCLGGDAVIQLGAQRAEINERCLGCGLCVEVCPEHAISIQIEPLENITHELMQRISNRTQIQKMGDPSNPGW